MRRNEDGLNSGNYKNTWIEVW